MRKAIASVIVLGIGCMMMVMTPGRINAWRWVRDHGGCVIRVDYRDIERGRQYSARATELTPDQASDELSADDLQRLTVAVEARGGVRIEE